MFFTDDGGRFAELSDLMEEIFSICDDDPVCIAAKLEKLEPDTRREILHSDLLNAWQVFWYYFRAFPGDEAVEFLTFHPAGDLIQGVPMGDIDIFTLVFQIADEEPEISIADDLQEVARFRGASAWNDCRSFIHKGE